MLERKIEQPLLSIITVVFNSALLIRDTLQSVASVKNKGIEYILIDGGSTDETNEIVNSYLSIIDVYISEGDSGIYDAMNKGIELASGEFVCFLNSGDIYLPDFPNVVKKNLTDHYDIFAFGIYEKSENGDFFTKMPLECNLQNFDPQFMYLPHPGIIARKELFDKYGLFDVLYKSSSDLDWVNRVLINLDFKYKIIKTPIVIFLLGGMSSSYISFTETRRIAIKYGKSIFKSNWVFIKQVILLLFYKLKKH